MIPNTEIKASLTPEIRLKQAMKEVGVEDAALVRKLNIPASLTGYEFLAYINEECPGLTSITVHPDNPEFASENGVLFSKNKKRLISCPVGRKGDYVIPDTTVEIGNLAFYGCAGLTSIIIPDTVVTIGRGAFHGCVDLTSVTIPDSVKVIGHGAFSGCYGLSSVIMPDSGVKMGENVFSGCIRLIISYAAFSHK